MLQIRNLTSEDLIINMTRLPASEVYSVSQDREVSWGKSEEAITAVVNNQIQVIRNGFEYTTIVDQLSALQNNIVRLDENRDSDGVVLQRLKIAAQGAKACLETFEFETSKLSSIHSKTSDGADTNYCTIKFYNDSNVELTTQEDIDSGCVKTVVDFEPPTNYEIIGGKGTILQTPSDDVRVWVVGVPDVPAAFGGSVEFLRGVNMRFALDREFKHDGRVPKFMPYSSTLHTNKFRFVIKHSAGSKHKFMISLEVFYP